MVRELNWLITGERYADAYRKGAFGRIRPHNNFTPQGGSGAIELGLRFSRLEGSDFVSGNPAGSGVLPTTLANGAEAWTYGVKWIVNPNVRFLMNYVDTRFDTPVTVGGVTAKHERGLIVRSQLSF